MKNDLTTQVVLLIAGAIAGIFSGAIGAFYKAFLDKRLESQKSDAAVRLQYLYPLLVVALDLKRKLAHAFETLQGEKEVTTPEPKMTDRYYLRHWFWRCKDFVVNPDANWGEEKRRRDLSMVSGGEGYDAASTLYVTANYLWHATRIRVVVPSELGGKVAQLLSSLYRVRTEFGKLEFYGVAQDSIGSLMTGRNGGVMSYREFCEAITSDAQRAWFLTLTDTYFKLYRQQPKNVEDTLEALGILVDLLREMLKLSPGQSVETI